MRKLTFALVITLFILSFTKAQSQQGFNYQAVIRNSNGEPIANQLVTIRIELLNADGTNLYLKEEHSVTSTSHGVVSLIVGEGDNIAGTFADIPWANGEIYMKVEVDPAGRNSFTQLGVSRLNAVPFALFAADGNPGPKGESGKDGLSAYEVWLASGNTGSESDFISSLKGDAGEKGDIGEPGVDGISIQWLGSFNAIPSNPSNNQAYYNITDGKSYIYNGTTWEILAQDGAQGPQGPQGQAGPLVAGSAGQILTNNGSTWVATSALHINSNSVGIGTTSPAAKLDVIGDIRSSGKLMGQSVQVGVPVSDPDEPLFVVRNNTGQIVFAVYEAGVRVYVDSDNSKSSKGGFAVGGLTPAKAGDTEFFRVTPDSVRIYIDTEEPASGKSSKGGFAVGGLTPAKTGTEEYLRITRDSSRIYVNTTGAKSGTKGGFAVGGLSPAKAGENNFMFLTPENYFIGHESGQQVTTGQFNSTLGYRAGKSLTTGRSNIFIGLEAGMNTTIGRWNTVLGFQAGKENISGDFNTFLGYYAGWKNTVGSSNVFIGNQSGQANESGSNNVFLGYYSGYSNYASFNTFLGYQSGVSNTTGTNNVFIGYNAGYSNTTGNNNVFIGNETGYLTQFGFSNVFVGDGAGRQGISSAWNVFVGYQSGYNTNDAGTHNVFLGHHSGFSNTTGWSNNFMGQGAGYSNTTGTNNIFIGNDAGRKNLISSGNIFIGRNAGYNSTEYGNTIIGHTAGEFFEVGSNNTFLGSLAGYNRTGGNSNLILGSYANHSGGSGNNNTIIGNGAGYNATGSGNVLIGYAAGWSENGDNKLYIANNSGSNPLIYGEFNNQKLRFNASVNVRDFMVLEPQSSPPASPAKGTVYFDNNDNKLKVWDGTQWRALW